MTRPWWMEIDENHKVVTWLVTIGYWLVALAVIAIDIGIVIGIWAAVTW